MIMLTMKKFYVNNSQSLFKGRGRPQWLSIVSLISEHLLLFSLVLTNNFLDEQAKTDSSVSGLKWISLHKIDGSALNIIVAVFLALNLLIYILILSLVIQFYMKPYKQKRVALVSICVLNYNSFIFIPSTLLSIKCLSGISVGNIFLTFLLSLNSQIHQQNYYHFYCTDYLSKRGSIWDISKVIVLMIGMVSIEISEQYNAFSYFIIGFSLINGINLLNYNLFHNKLISKIFLFLNVILMSLSILVGAKINIYNSPSFALIALSYLPLCMKISDFFLESIHKKIISQVNNLTFAISNTRVGREVIPNSDFLIDYYTRFLISSVNCISKEKHIFAAFFTKLTIFPLKNQDLDQNFNISQFVEKQEVTSLQSMKEKMIEIQEKLEGKQIAVQQTEDHNSKRQTNTIRQLYYILEIDQNYPLVAIKLFEYMDFCKKGMGIIQESILKSLKHELQKREKQISKSEINLGDTFMFEESIQRVSNLLLLVLKQKMKFLQELSQDVIDLMNLQYEGEKLFKMREEIAIELLNLKQICLSSQDLNFLYSTFLENLWMDSRDRKLALLNLGEKNTMKLKKLLKIQTKSNKFDVEQFSAKSCSLLVSLNSLRLGKILKISKNTEKLIGFRSIDLLNKNCNVMQCHSIQKCHNFVIREGIDRGLFRDYNKSNSPLIIKKRDGFGLRISLEFQVHTFVQPGSDIALISRINIEEKEFEKYILADTSNGGCKVEIISETLFKSIFVKYFNDPSDLDGVQIQQIIPSLSLIDNYMKQKNLKKYKFKSLAFLPFEKEKIEKRRKRFFDSSSDLITCIQNKYFNLSWNDVYQTDISIKCFQRKDAYELVFIKLKNISIINEEDQILAAIKSVFFQHLSSIQLIPEVTSHLLDAIYKRDDKELIFDKGTQIQIQRVKQTLKNDLLSHDTSLNFYQSLQQIHELSESNLSHQVKEDHIYHDQSIQRNLTSNLELGNRSHNPTLTFPSNGMDTFIQSPKGYQENAYDMSSSRKQSQKYFTYDQRQNSLRIITQLKEDTSRSNLISPNSQEQNRLTQAHTNWMVKINEAKVDTTQQLLSSPKASEQAKLINTQEIPIQKSYKQQNSISQDEGNSNNGNEALGKQWNQIDRQTKRGSISSQFTSQSDSLKSAVKKKIEDQKQRKLLKFVFGTITLGFLGMLILVTITYLLLIKEIDSQQLSFTFSWWQDIISNHLITILRLDEVRSAINLGVFSFSLDPQIIAFRNKIQPTILSSFADFLNDLKKIAKHDSEDLYLQELLFEISLNYTIFNTVNLSTKNVTKSMYNVFAQISYETYAMTQDFQIYKPIMNLEILSNVFNIQYFLAQMVELQKQRQQNQVDEMNFLVVRTMIIILVISVFIGIIMLPLYSLFVAKREFILRLFASIEPANIKEMGESLNISITQLTRIQKVEQQGNSIQQSAFKLENQVYMTQKKKKNVPTTSLPKINMYLVFKVLIVTAFINIQPIVNVFLTSAQIQESQTELQIVKGLFSLESVLQNSEFAAYSLTNKLYNPYSKYMTYEMFYAYLQSSLQQIYAILTTTTQTLFEFSNSSQQSQKSISTFIKQVIQADLCLALEENSKYVTDFFDYELCITIYNGILKKGYLQSLGLYVEIFQSFEQIASIPDEGELKSQITSFFIHNDPQKTEYLLNMLQISNKAVVSALSYEKNSYFSKINLTQITLFVLEIALILFIFMVFIYPFFTEIRQQMVEVVKMISILQLQYIQSNTYIANFLKSN